MSSYAAAVQAVPQSASGIVLCAALIPSTILATVSIVFAIFTIITELVFHTTSHTYKRRFVHSYV